MTIKEVCKQYGITADTLRYYERVGVIPAVKRTAGGIRVYDEEAVRWVESAIFMRNSGVPVDALVEYVRLFQEGSGTFCERKELLEKVRADVQAKIDGYREALWRLDYKISRYDEAIRTGVLTWDKASLSEENAGDET
ncbi:MAG: MerR family transcriptional regulator [Oscillospiraceae bacterium]|nr:MerR family transcriptional regulator [Oscillospiraceae bacterium]